MSNPLIDKYEEIYGEKKEEVVEEKKSPTVEDFRESLLPGLLGGMADDILTLGGGTDTISFNPQHINPVFTINGGLEISSTPHTPNTFLLPQVTEMDKQLCKVMDDVAKGKAVVSEIKSEVDPTFTGFGGQIRYSIEIVGRYP
jgi:hypothetical protein